MFINMELYIVWYGEEYEDKAIFADLEKAKHKLNIQNKGREWYFTPFIEVYTLSSGIYKKTSYEYCVQDEDGEIINREC